MKFSEVQPGVYQASVVDWGLEEVEKLDDELKAVIQFEFKVGEESVQGKWEGFLKTKAGAPNKKTFTTMVMCGFESDDINNFIRGDALDMEKKLDITIEKVGEYNRIEWVNLQSSNSIKKVKDVKKLNGMNFKSALKDARKDLGLTPIKKIKNFAPGAEAIDEEMGF